jgi:hypothetical protein
MSEVSVSVKLTQKEAGRLYMSHQKRGEHIAELAKAIEAAAVRAGMINPDQELTGPDLLMLCNQFYA